MKIAFPVVESIRERRSVRTYEKKEVEAPLMEKMRAFIAEASNPFDIPVNVHIVNKNISEEGEKLGTYGTIKGATTFMGLSVGKVPLGLVAAGYQFESIVLYATSLGLGTVWLAATFSRSKFQAAMKIPDTDYFPAISPLGYPMKKRLFEKLMRKTMGSDNRKPWSEIFFNEDFSRPLDPSEAGEYQEALEMLRVAPSATNAQPWRVLKQGDTFHFFETHKDNARQEDALIKQVDLGIAISHFHLTMQQTKDIAGRFFVAEPEGVDVPATYHYLVSWTK